MTASFPVWVSHTGIGLAMRKSTILFPSIEVVHVLGLTLLLGSILATDMRLLGVGLRRQSPAEITTGLSPLFWTGLIAAVSTGVLMFVGEPVKCFFNEAFWWKMGLLAAAILFHLTLFRCASRSEAVSPAWRKTAGALSLALWFGVGVAGRVIGFI